MSKLVKKAIKDLESGAFKEAEATCRKILRTEPTNVDGLNLLGSALCQTGRAAEAVTVLRRARGLAPTSPYIKVNLANALITAGGGEQVAEAVTLLREVLATTPGMPQALHAMGLAQKRLGETRLALDHFRAAGEQGLAASHCEEGALLADLGRLDEAEEGFRVALARSPDMARAHGGLAGVLSDARKLPEAAEAALAAAKAAPETYAAQAWLAARSLCDWTLAARIERDWGKIIDRTASPYAVCLRHDDPAQQLAAARRACASFAGIQALPPRPITDKDRLVVGYLSNDFHHHATMHLVGQLFSQHDRKRIAVRVYSHDPLPADDYRRMAANGADAFVDIAGLSDEAAAQRIRDEGVDLLIDMKGHTARARLGILARRPAPVQLSWLGFPGSSGASFIDGVIADAHVVPPGIEAHFSEPVLRMPHSYQPGWRPGPLGTPPRRNDLGLPADAVVIAAFHAGQKISREAFALWMRILRDNGSAVLWLLADHAAIRANLAAAAEAEGVSRDRLLFADFAQRPEHLRRLSAADFAVDTFPYGGHTTTNDALLAGLPVVAWQGRSFPARVSAGLLQVQGIADTVADTADGFAAIAGRLCSDAAWRSALRARVAEARESGPLFDQKAFAAGLEELYFSAWESKARP